MAVCCLHRCLAPTLSPLPSSSRLAPRPSRPAPAPPAGMPEGVSIAKQALARGYALLGINSKDRSVGSGARCWRWGPPPPCPGSCVGGLPASRAGSQRRRPASLRWLRWQPVLACRPSSTTFIALRLTAEQPPVFPPPRALSCAAAGPRTRCRCGMWCAPSGRSFSWRISPSSSPAAHVGWHRCRSSVATTFAAVACVLCWCPFVLPPPRRRCMWPPHRAEPRPAVPPPRAACSRRLAGAAPAGHHAH